MNPVGSVCMTAFGPRLDLLRRKADYYTRYGSTIEEGKEKRGWKWWLCVSECRMYFYQYYGDMNPRYVSDVRYAQACVPEKSRDDNVVLIKHSDGRVWRLLLGSVLDANRLLFAITEASLVARGKPSQFLRTPFGSQLLPQRSFGHTCIQEESEVSSAAVLRQSTAYEEEEEETETQKSME